MKNTIKIDNDSKKILIIGANGFLGKNLIQISNNKENKIQDSSFLAADLKNTSIPSEIPFYNLDITNTKDTIKKIVRISPDVIILTAAMTNVDKCEINKKLATEINTTGTKNVMKACEEIGSKLVFISTDFVFDGMKKKGHYNEEDVPNPLNHYGKTKYEAELALINSNINYLICRTAVLYGWNKSGINFITWVLKNLEQKNKIKIVTSQVNSATFVKNLALIILKLLNKKAGGIYHTAGAETLNRHEMALKCAEVFNFDKNLIVPIKHFEQRAIRPENVGLDVTKLKKLIGSECKIYNLSEGLEFMKSNREY